MTRQLSLSARPRTLDGLIGQADTVANIRGHMGTDRIVSSWLFYGPRGTGKTSAARIMALAYNCEHQELFGRPCAECVARKEEFSIHDINCADATGIEKLRQLLQGADYGVLTGKYRVYILDEVQRASKNAQDLLLKYLEDTPESTIFILLTTEPQSLQEAMRSRCVSYPFKKLDEIDMTTLITRLLKRAGSKLPVDRLVFELLEKKVHCPRDIVQCVEKYIAGAEITELASDNIEGLDALAMQRSVMFGNWGEVAAMISANRHINFRALRALMLAYMHTMLLNTPEVGDRSSAVAESIILLATMQNAEDSTVAAALSATLHRCCALFLKYKQN